MPPIRTYNYKHINQVDVITVRVHGYQQDALSKLSELVKNPTDWVLQ